MASFFTEPRASSELEMMSQERLPTREMKRKHGSSSPVDPSSFPDMPPAGDGALKGGDTAAAVIVPVMPATTGTVVTYAPPLAVVVARLAAARDPLAASTVVTGWGLSALELFHRSGVRSPA